MVEEEEETPHRNWKADVREAAQALASEAWRARDEAGELQRVDEIRRLVDAQIHDDTSNTSISQRDRIGRTWVSYWDMNPFNPPVWPHYTDEQVSLQTALRALVDVVLEAEERVLVRLVYDGGLTQREIAGQLGISQPAIKKRLDRIYRRLRATLTTAYGTREDKSDAEG